MQTWCNSALPNVLPAAIRRHRDELCGSRGRDYSQGEFEALSELAGLVERLPLDDPRLVSLMLVRGQMGDSDTWEPAEEQLTYLSTVGQSGHKEPSSENSLNRLVTASIEDLLEFKNGQVRRLDAQTVRDRSRAEELADADRERNDLRLEVESLQVELEAARQELADTTKQRDLLRTYGNGKPKKERRKAVDGHTGIYTADTADGQKYEVGWTEDGKQRWKTIGPDLEEACRFRAQVTGDPVPVAA